MSKPTALDVRKMKVCLYCQKLGIYQPKNPTVEVPLVICCHYAVAKKSERRAFAHPRCYIKHMGVAKLLTWPKSELDPIRLCDVPLSVIRAISDGILSGRIR